MSDLRDLPPDHAFLIPQNQVGNETWEIDLRLATYSSINIDKVAPKLITVTLKTMGFAETVAQATLLRDAYKLMHDLWNVSIVRLERKTG